MRPEGARIGLSRFESMDSLRSPFGRLRRLSPLRGSVELPTRGFLEIQVVDSIVLIEKRSNNSQHDRIHASTCHAFARCAAMSGFSWSFISCCYSIRTISLLFDRYPACSRPSPLRTYQAFLLHGGEDFANHLSADVGQIAL